MATDTYRGTHCRGHICRWWRVLVVRDTTNQIYASARPYQRYLHHIGSAGGINTDSVYDM